MRMQAANPVSQQSGLATIETKVGFAGVLGSHLDRQRLRTGKRRLRPSIRRSRLPTFPKARRRPRPVFGPFAQTCSNRVIFYVSDDPQRLLMVARPVIVR